jgi:Ni/Fe-hydrogenase 1 B-type cytochrome subunit
MSAASPTAEGRPSAAQAEQRIAVTVWDLPLRLMHWTIALSLFVLAATGYAIGRPFLSVPGEAGDRFVMGWMKAVHLYAAIAFTVAVLARLWWMFAGNRWASWRQLVPTTAERWRRFAETLRFYTFLRVDAPPEIGHNPLAGLTYVAVYALCLLEIATGLALYGASAAWDSPLRGFAGLATPLGGLQMTRWIHHVVMWLLLGFFVHHLASALLVSSVERNGLMGSIFSGAKFVTREALEGERREGGA